MQTAHNRGIVKKQDDKLSRKERAADGRKAKKKEIESKRYFMAMQGEEILSLALSR